MKIGGLQKVSLIDFPGMICAVVFLQGCNFQCSYCHNPELVRPELFGPVIDEKKLLKFLEARRGKLDAVTITGGEPSLQKGLPAFVRKIRKKGFAVKLDANGSHPQILQALLKENLLDYVAMDVKGPWEKYEKIVNVKVEIEKIKESVINIIHSGIPHEFRTTIVKSQLNQKDILQIAANISGAQKYALQKFVPGKILEEKFLSEETYAEAELEGIKKCLEKQISFVIVR